MIFNEPSKQQAREFLLSTYYKRYGRDHIPNDQQYWTLCAECIHNRKLIVGTELHQLIEAGFIKTDQFHGVDKDLATINKNKQYRGVINRMPLGSGPWWHHGDLYSILNGGVFNPAVVHYDSMLGPTKAMRYTLRLMKTLSKVKGPVMLAANVALQWKWSVKNSQRPRTFNDIVFAMMRDSKLTDMFNQGWDPNVEYRSYAGLKDNMSQMGTIVLFKN